MCNVTLSVFHSPLVYFFSCLKSPPRPTIKVYSILFNSKEHWLALPWRLFTPRVNPERNERVNSQRQIQGMRRTRECEGEHKMMALSFMFSCLCWRYRTDIIIRNYHLLPQEATKAEGAMFHVSAIHAAALSWNYWLIDVGDAKVITVRQKKDLFIFLWFYCLKVSYFVATNCFVAITRSAYLQEHFS